MTVGRHGGYCWWEIIENFYVLLFFFFFVARITLFS